MKKYLSVISMVRDIGDSKLSDAVERRIANKSIKAKKMVKSRLVKINKLILEIEELLLHV